MGNFIRKVTDTYKEDSLAGPAGDQSKLTNWDEFLEDDKDFAA